MDSKWGNGCQWLGRSRLAQFHKPHPIWLGWESAPRRPVLKCSCRAGPAPLAMSGRALGETCGLSESGQRGWRQDTSDRVRRLNIFIDSAQSSAATSMGPARTSRFSNSHGTNADGWSTAWPSKSCGTRPGDWRLGDDAAICLDVPHVLIHWCKSRWCLAYGSALPWSVHWWLG